MTGTARVLAAVGLSVAANAVLLLTIDRAIAPGPPPEQAEPTLREIIATEPVSESRAQERAAEAPAANEGTATALNAEGAAVQSSTAQAAPVQTVPAADLPAPGETSAALDPDRTAAATVENAVQPLTEATPDRARATVAQVSPVRPAATPATAQPLRAVTGTAAASRALAVPRAQAQAASGATTPATALRAEASSSAPQPLPATAATARDPAPVAARARVPAGQRLSVEVPAATIAAPATAQATNARAATPAPVSASVAAATAVTARPAQAAATRPAEATGTAVALAAQPAVARQSDAVTAPAERMVATRPPSTAARAGTARGLRAIPRQPEILRPPAPTAWSGDSGATLDALSLGAIAAFTGQAAEARPGTTTTVRDRVGTALDGAACSRLQTRFDPDSGSLEVVGHVSEAAFQPEIVTALEAIVGTSIPVRDRTRVLGRPVCGLLEAFDGIGLPQSTDQVAGPGIVGPEPFAHEFRFTGGDPMILALQGPDYPSYVYVDYYDAGGNVLHLHPNELSPQHRLAPDGAFQIGDDPDGLVLTVAPPYGLELAVAVALSDPLPRGVASGLVEPARPYLARLTAALAGMRSGNPDLRGEWAYFLVRTEAPE